MALFLSLEKCVNFDWNSLSTSTLVHKEVFNVCLRFKFELSVAFLDFLGCSTMSAKSCFEKEMSDHDFSDLNILILLFLPITKCFVFPI